MNVNELRKYFPPLNDETLVYLDNAASSLKPTVVINAINDYYLNYGCNVSRGTYKISYDATEIIEEARKKIAKFINASPEEIVFTKGASDSLNMIARCYGSLLENGDEIVTSELEHHSNFLPWLNVKKEKNLEIRFIELTKEGRITLENFKNVINDKTKVVVLTHVSNVLGYITPIKEITSIAHKHNAIVVLDVAQSISHLKVDVKDLDVDFLGFSFHKMMGPTGIGVMFGKKELLNKMPPAEFGGDMNDNVDKDQVTYKEIPHKFETGTPAIAEIFGAGAAIDFLNKINYLELEDYVVGLKNYTMNKLKKIDGITIYNETAETGIIDFNINNVHAHDSVTYFSDKNICLRAGHHCAQLLVKWLKVPSTLRASFYFYNTYEECDKFVAAVKDAVKFFQEVGF